MIISKINVSYFVSISSSKVTVLNCAKEGCQMKTIIVELMSSQTGWAASFEGDPTGREIGDSKAEAIGKLILSYGDVLGVRVLKR